MTVLGIVAEYNPFHNGHKYHLEESKKRCGADYAVCVMSGNFIQRGEPALVNKWARAEMALLSGADLVLELPTPYAMASAEYFASGAVKILDSLGIVDFLSFGSERGDIGELKLAAEVLGDEPEQYRTMLKELLRSGCSYPAAREAALEAYLAPGGGSAQGLAGLLGSPNSILGVEYLKALKKLSSRIQPFTIERISNDYNEPELTGRISSATSIRKAVFESQESSALQADGDLQSGGYLQAGKPSQSGSSLKAGDALSAAVPESTLNILKREFEQGRGPVSRKSYEGIILALLRKMSIEEISRLPYVSEGLENRIKEAANSSGSLDELFDRLCTKRYTRTRLQRTVLSVLTGLTASVFDSFNLYGGPQYIRVLGFNRSGRILLAEAKTKANLPIIVKTANFKNSCNPLLRRMLELESSATDIYVLGYENPVFRKAGQEFTQNVVRA